MGNDTDTKAIVVIQRWWRAQLWRKKYAILHTLPSDLTHDKAFLVGNDPYISDLDAYAGTGAGKNALIATSGLRALSFICALSQESQQIPKLIIVDNSTKVVRLWRLIRDLAEHADVTQPQEFIRAFHHLLLDNHSLFHRMTDDAYYCYNSDLVTYENQNSILFMRALVHRYGLDYILAIIRHTSIFAQSWTNVAFFTALKNIMDLQGVSRIYAYPSNIYYCALAPDATRVVRSIQQLEPVVSIETNRCPRHGIPEQQFLISWSEQQQREPLRWLKQHRAIQQLLSEFNFNLVAFETHEPWVGQVIRNVYGCLNQARIDTFTAPTRTKISNFMQYSQKVVNKAITQLQYDCAWAEYLLNLGKRIANILVFAITGGLSAGLFAVSLSQASLFVDDLGEDIHQVFCTQSRASY